MNKKFLYYAAGLALFSVAVMIAAVMFTDFKYPAQSQGTLVFAKTYQDGAELDRIVVRSAAETVTLELKDNLWRVKESGGYYAGTYLLNTLLKDLNTSVFYSRRENTPQAVREFNLEEPQTGGKNSGVRLSVYAGEKLQDTLILGKTTENDLYRFARLDNGEIWLISGRFELPAQAYSWLLQPVLELPSTLIETIRFYQDGVQTTVGRKDSTRDFSDSEGRMVKALAQTGLLEHLTVENALDEASFARLKATLIRRMEIITFQGLIFYLDFYVDAQQKNWLRINLSTTPLPMTIVNDYIKDNRFLYDGWYFELSPETAKLLSPSSLI